MSSSGLTVEAIEENGSMDDSMVRVLIFQAMGRLNMGSGEMVRESDGSAEKAWSEIFR